MGNAILTFYEKCEKIEEETDNIENQKKIGIGDSLSQTSKHVITSKIEIQKGFSTEQKMKSLENTSGNNISFNMKKIPEEIKEEN